MLIAGAGPAGLATALYADRAGIEVTVLEPRTGPIDKACGEGLMPSAVRALADLGVRPAGQEFYGIRYLAGDAAADARFTGAPGLGVRRTVLHTALAEQVTARGIAVRPGTVDKIERSAHGVRVGDLEADWLVGADGLHSTVRRLAGLDPGRGTRHRRFGLRRHFRIAPWSDLVEVYWSAGSEAYVTPVADDLVGVAVLSSGGSFDDLMAAHPALAARLAGAPAEPVRGAGPLRQRVRRRVSGRVLLVGDAAGYVDALTGEGLSIALKASKALVDAVAAGRPTDYESAWRRSTRTYRWSTSAMVLATRSGPIRRALVPAAARLPRVFGAVVNTLAR